MKAAERVLVWVNEAADIAAAVSECQKKHPGAAVAVRNPQFFNPSMPDSRGVQAYVAAGFDSVVQWYESEGIPVSVLGQKAPEAATGGDSPRPEKSATTTTGKRSRGKR